MPLYEYQCDECAHRFELIQKFSDPPARVCPKCGGAVKKLLSSPAIQFKGTGWYITDYARSGKSEPGQAPKGEKGEGGGAGESKAGPTSESKGGSKGETKAETKAESKPSASTPTSD